MPLSFDEAVYTVADAAELTGFDAGNLRSCFQRGFLGLRGEDVAASPGGVRYLTLRRVVQIAVANRLMRLGVGTPAAFHAAMAFSDRSSPELFWDQEVRENRRFVVHGCELFPVGRTLLVVSRLAGLPLAQVRCSAAFETVDSMLDACSDEGGALVVDVGPILTDVVERARRMREGA